eukprot:g47209.t1
MGNSKILDVTLKDHFANEEVWQKTGLRTSKYRSPCQPECKRNCDELGTESGCPLTQMELKELNLGSHDIESTVLPSPSWMGDIKISGPICK